MLYYQALTNVDKKGLPLTVRTVFVIDPKKVIRLTLTYPAATGRNFDEILRVIDALQTNDAGPFATPADWKPGDRVISCYMQSWDRGPSQPSDRRQTLGSPLDGVLCEQRVFPQGFVVAAPETLTDDACATLPIAALTA